MVEKQMKTFTAGDTKYIITDAQAREDIEELKSNLQYSITQTDLPTTATSYPFNFIAGHKYRLTVVGSGVTSFYRFFTTNNGLSTGEVDNFGSFKDGEKTVELEATANATHIRKGSYPEGSVSFTLTDLSSIDERLTKAEEDLEEVIKGTECGGAILQPEKIQAVVAAGKARDYFDIGDVIYIPWTNYTPSTPVIYQFPFVVVHIGDVYDENDVKHENALWLMAMYAEPEEIIFDAAEDWTVNLSEEPNALEGWYYWGLTGTTDYTELKLTAGDPIPTTYDSVHRCAINHLSVLRYGYNRWRDSAYRQWLNSSVAKNANWWTSQHNGDVAPTATYTNKPGWLYGFEDRWLDIIKPVRVQTACNTVTDGGVTDVTYDRFFLPSLEQMYGNPQVSGVEGDFWEYWKEETGLEAPNNGSSTNTNDARKISNITNHPRGAAVGCRLRSAYRSTSSNVWSCGSAGYLGYYGIAASSYRAQPACVIF